ncbi:terminase small subunit [Pectobacterium parmentieri]|uniref:terminase small subunit n=1 Tax=Pectobacterium parmentieri TaxID=1905730 RepID=UPI0013741AD8|nr:terminase small subunit [Pectobacterium parmentieri]QHQ14570.1 terminase small subunit [Pectobacterium parmentieri]
MALTDKQEMFCREYLVDLNATQAAIRAGYSEKTAQEQSSRLLSNVMVQKRIAELKSERNDSVGVDALYVLRRLVEIDQMDVIDIVRDDLSLKPVTEWPPVWRRYISGFDVAEMFDYSGEDGGKELAGILKKIKWPDKVKNLELLGKHVEVNAFKETHEVNITAISDRMAKARKRLNGG